MQIIPMLFSISITILRLGSLPTTIPYSLILLSTWRFISSSWLNIPTKAPRSSFSSLYRICQWACSNPHIRNCLISSLRSNIWAVAKAILIIIAEINVVRLGRLIVVWLNWVLRTTSKDVDSWEAFSFASNFIRINLCDIIWAWINLSTFTWLESISSLFRYRIGIISALRPSSISIQEAWS